MVKLVVPGAFDRFRELMKAPISDLDRGIVKAFASSGVTLGILIPLRKSFTCSGSLFHGFCLYIFIYIDVDD